MTEEIEKNVTVPGHINETARASAEWSAEHQRRASPSTRVLHALITRLGSPLASSVFAVGIVLWVLSNLCLLRLGRLPFDPLPFPLLGTCLSAITVITTLMILTSQRHESGLSENRAQLTLELVMISEQKTAKIIEMLTTLRRESPGCQSPEDPTAVAFATPAAPKTVLDTLEESRRISHIDIQHNQETQRAS